MIPILKIVGLLLIVTLSSPTMWGETGKVEKKEKSPIERVRAGDRSALTQENFLNPENEKLLLELLSDENVKSIHANIITVIYQVEILRWDTSDPAQCRELRNQAMGAMLLYALRGVNQNHRGFALLTAWEIATVESVQKFPEMVMELLERNDADSNRTGIYMYSMLRGANLWLNENPRIYDVLTLNTAA